MPVSPQPRPSGILAMHQKWRRLLFLHWMWDAREVQATLPAGLTVDEWDERAWIGIVPFKMEGIRPRFCPAVPGISNFPELNVRTYVRDGTGRPGVWFYSLDCSQPLAVWAARAFFGLPYFHAKMREVPGEIISYECRRRSAAGASHYRYAGAGNCMPAREGTLEQFLIERYRLFALRRGRLFTGEVWHDPYEIEAADVAGWSADPLRQAGFESGDRPPDHAVFSTGVDVQVFGIEPG